MAEQVTHITLNARYRVVIERAASTKGTLGYKIEANGDDYNVAMTEIDEMKKAVEIIAGAAVTENKEVK